MVGRKEVVSSCLVIVQFFTTENEEIHCDGEKCDQRSRHVVT